MRCWPLLFTLAACQTAAGGGDDSPTVDAPGGSGGGGTNVFAATTTKVVIEIDYETGQEPYTGNVVTFGETWDVAKTNVDRLFAGKKVVTIPTTLPDMENIGVVDDEELTLADLAAIADAHRGVRDSADTKVYYMLWVSGHFADGDGLHDNVLGISFGNTIAIFKDVIKSTGSFTNPNVVRYVEQSTVVHELAHSIGLVDNGIPMVAAHKDEAHGAHCTNPDCAMYWLNEASNDARDYALRRLTSSNTVLFDDGCLADVDALTGGP